MTRSADSSSKALEALAESVATYAIEGAVESGFLEYLKEAYELGRREAIEECAEACLTEARVQAMCLQADASNAADACVRRIRALLFTRKEPSDG